jgi:hypothetical protein
MSDRRAQWLQLKARAQQLLRRDFDPNEPRDPEGKWTDGGDADDAKLDPKVVQVGGDAWNKATARRLEREYQSAKPALDKLATDAVGKETSEPQDVESEDEDEAPYVPESWDELSNDQQEQGFEAYKDQNLQSYIDNEQQNYYDSGDALDDAKSELAHTTMHGPGADHDEWLIEAIDAYRESDDAPRIPYSTQDLVDAISLDYQNGNQGSGDFSVDFDDSKLQKPSNLPPPEQQTLPGIEPVKPEEQLTEAMRDGISKAIEKAFDEKADEKAGDMQAPDYLNESATEMVESDWQHNMSDDSKFEWIKNNTDLIEGETPSKPSPDAPETMQVEALPKQFDPLNLTSGEDYKRTQALARHLSVERAAQVLTARDLDEQFDAKGNIVKISPSVLRDRLSKVDAQLWSAWKASSTSEDGKLLQVATAEELGGRLNAKTAALIDPDEAKARANTRFEGIGGYKGIKAYVRAKWETTQYLLDKAGTQILDVYRGIRIPSDQFQQAMTQMKAMLARMIGDHKHLPTLQVVRNGAASTTVDPNIANGWGADEGRIVLRAQVPRTAAVSVPAYGINIHSEREVVVAGTAWKGWDAWAEEAPNFKDVPLAA